jgi:chemotaxis protein CheD
MKKRGAGKHRIQMRLIGGGRIPGDSPEDAGTKNYIFVREYVSRKGLSILNEDLGGIYVRRVHFFPTTGRAVRMVLRRDGDFTAIEALEKKVPGKI